jgi:hypothetical protein
MSGSELVHECERHSGNAPIKIGIMRDEENSHRGLLQGVTRSKDGSTSSDNCI